MPIPQIDYSKYIPGFSAHSAQASANIGQQLGGLPSAGPARNKAAYFGATSGLPNSGVSNALGYDLFNQDAQQYQQQGFDNLIKMLQGYSGTVAPTTGQALQSSQFDTEFNDRRRREELSRADAEAAMAAARRPRPSNGLYRSSGQAGYGQGASSLPWWNRN